MVKLTKEDIRERKEVRNYDSNRVSQSKIKEILRKNGALQFGRFTVSIW